MRNHLITISWIVLVSQLLLACGSSGNNPEDNDNIESSPVMLTKVFKYDNTIQCEDQGIPLEVMQQELTTANVNVVCAQKGNDGLVRITVCGTATGNINIYEIPKSQLEIAESLEFIPVETLSEYGDTPCKP